MKVNRVKKRDGRIVKFDEERLKRAITLAFKGAGNHDEKAINKVYNKVIKLINDTIEEGKDYIEVEKIQDIIEITLMKEGYFNVAKQFILYREEKRKIREEKAKILGKNPNKLTDIEKKFSLNAIRLLASRYLIKNPETGKIIESVDDLFKRVAVLGAIPEILYDDKVYDKQPTHFDVWEKTKPELEELRKQWKENKEQFRDKYSILKGFNLNEYHFERLLYAYENLAKQGHMKITIKELLKMLEESPEQFEKARYYVRKFFELMANQVIMPNTPALVNAGRKLGLLSACFVLSVADSMASIMDTAKEIALISKAGGGIGLDFSTLRPDHPSVPLNSTGNPSSGVISWLELYNKVLEVVRQSSIRRGAGMGVLWYWHTELEKFIHAKEQNRGDNVISNFNLSIGTDEKFWKAVLNDTTIDIIANKQIVNDETGEVIKEIRKKIGERRALDVLDEASRLAWAKGDPGILYFDNHNKYNIRKNYMGLIRATNPCVIGSTKILTSIGEIEIEKLFQIAKEEHETFLTPIMQVEESKIAPEGEPTAYYSPYNIIIDGKEYHAFVWKMGKKKLIRIKTETGKELTADVEHIVYTPEGEVKLQNLQVKDKIKTINGWEEVVEIEPAGEDIVYTLTVDEVHKYYANGILSKNCGEEGLYPYESCNLSSINLEKFVKYDDEGEAYFDWEEYNEVIRINARLLDNFIDVNNFPLKKIEERTKMGRNIGAGLMGLANTLYRLKIPYNSEEGYKLMSKFAEHLTYYSFKESVQLARERGTFSYFDKTDYVKGHLPIAGYYDKKAWTLPWDELVEEIKKDGLRNVDVTTSPPTGSVSMIADTSSGIEPLFALAYKKVVTVGTFYYTNTVLEEELKKRGLYDEKILEKIVNNFGSVQGIKEIPKDIQKVFVTAMDIHWLDHIVAQAMLQKWITNSISKTINMPHGASVEDVKLAYVIAHELGCKGLTVYRDGSLDIQVYQTEKRNYRAYDQKPSKYALKLLKKLLEEKPQLMRFIRESRLAEYFEEKREEQKSAPAPTLTFSLGSLSHKREEKKEKHEHKGAPMMKTNGDIDSEKIEELLGVKYCPVCWEERGELVELVHEGGCKSCPACGWSACTVA